MITPGQDITGAVLDGISFAGPGDPLIVVRALDTFSSGRGGWGPEHVLIATTPENVLSPGGAELPFQGSGQQDDLTLTFVPPVTAFGLDLLWQSSDGVPLTVITVRDAGGNIIFSGPPEMTNLGGPGAPAGTDFWGIVSLSPAISSVEIDESDDGLGNPDSNIGFDTILYSGPSLGSSFCFGVSCPCGNDDVVTGCVNSTGTGACLSGAGSTSVGLDNLVLTAANCPPNNTGLFFMGGSTFPPVFVGDGLGCTGGLFRFFPGVVDASGVLTLMNPIANAPAGMIQNGDTRHFQAWTRDVLCGPPPAPCPTPCGNGSNLTNGYTVTFTP